MHCNSVTLTRSKSNHDIEDVDEIADVVETDPDGTVGDLQVGQHCASDNDGQIVDGGQCDDGKPAIVRVGGRVNRPTTKPPDITAMFKRIKRYGYTKHNPTLSDL